MFICIPNLGICFIFLVSCKTSPLIQGTGFIEDSLKQAVIYLFGTTNSIWMTKNNGVAFRDTIG